MTKTQAIKAILGLSVGGVLFAGYLTFSSLVLKRCAFGEPCPQLFGQPTCLYGFALFLILALLAVTSIFHLLERKLADKLTVAVAVAGTIFAARYAGPEVIQIFDGRRFVMGLPTCAWGGVFFVAVLVLSIIAYRRSEVSAPATPEVH